jgi:DNA-directed RNA polymerase specialized sigma24 family protein
MVTTARIRMSASADSSGSHRYGSTLSEVIAGGSYGQLTRAALRDTAERLRATLPDEMAMVELRHIEGATYNEIGDLIGDGFNRTAARTLVGDAQARLRAVAGPAISELLAC